jgi:8-oxo-dGTP diphosphatase
VTDRFRVVPAAYVFLRRRNRSYEESVARGDPADQSVLLQLRQNTGYRDGYWAAAAAGHVEEDESVLQAAVREAREELGVALRPNTLEPLCAMHRTHANGRPIDERVDFFYSCTVWSGEPRIVEPEKSARIEWFSLDALPDNVVPHERVVLNALASGRVPPIITYGF